MAAYDLEEQEQLAELKAWWKQYGNLLTNALLGVLVVILAWQGWGLYQGKQAGQAATIFSVLQQAAQAKDAQKIKAASGELLEKFSGTRYASLGALTAAKALVDAGDTKTARLQLSWVVDHGQDEFRDLARLRLASLLLEDKEYEPALKQLEGKPLASFEARFAELRGDILSAQTKKADAVVAYKAALARLDVEDKEAKDSGQGGPGQTSAIARELIQLKLDALGGSK